MPSCGSADEERLLASGRRPTRLESTAGSEERPLVPWCGGWELGVGRRQRGRNAVKLGLVGNLGWAVAVWAFAGVFFLTGYVVVSFGLFG